MKKRIITGAIFFALIGSAILFFGRNKNQSGNQSLKTESGLVLEGEIPPVVDYGVTAYGFENSVNLFSYNAKAKICDYQRIDGTKSLMIKYEKKEGAVKIEDYIDGAYKDAYYRLGFWAKSDQDGDLAVSLSKNGQIQKLGSVNLAGDTETRYYEFIFGAQIDVTDAVFSWQTDKSATVWIDDLAVSEIAADSDGNISAIKPTMAGETRWQIPFSGGADLTEKNSDVSLNTADFFSVPDRRRGSVVSAQKDGFISGLSLMAKRVGSGSTKGNFQAQIFEIDESLGIPRKNPIASAVINHSPDPWKIEEIAVEEKTVKENEKAAAKKEEGNQEEETKPGGNDSLDQKLKEVAEKYNAWEEIRVPISAKVEAGKKYWIGISNESANVDENNYLIFSERESKNGRILFSEDQGSEWKDETGTMRIGLFSPVHSVYGGMEIPSGLLVSDMGGGEGSVRYLLGEKDSALSSGLGGRKIYDLNGGQQEGTNLSGDIMLSADENDYAAYKIPVFHPVSKIILRNIVYYKSLLLEISFDGENWEEIFSDKLSNDTSAGTVKNVVIGGDQKSREFFVRVSPNGKDAIFSGLDLEADFSFE